MGVKVTISALASKTIDIGKYNDRNKTICKFTPHYMDGNLSAEDCANMHKNESRDASANYYIGSDGTIVAGMQEEKRSWCSSSGENDHQAITVEIANINKNGDVTQEAWNAAVNLAADVCTRYNFKLNWTGDKSGSLTCHYMFSSTDCPGNYLKGKMQQFADEVNSKIGNVGNMTGASGANSTGSTAGSDDLNSLIPAGVINLEFSYGYNDGQMSEVHRGVMTEYDVAFTPFGSTLTIEGVSREFVSFNDPKSVTYKGMTIEEIVRSIAEEEGWIVDDDSIEPIAEVKESTVYSLTTGSGGTTGGLPNIYDNGSSSGGGTITDGPVSALQQKVVDSANSHNTGRAGYCEAWAEEVLEAAGVPRKRMASAAEACRQFCHSTNRSELKVGMIVCTEVSGGTGDHNGHVGIYIGNGNVRHNGGGTVKTDTLDDWIGVYGPNGSHHGGEVRWGWYNDYDLTQH